MLTANLTYQLLVFLVTTADPCHTAMYATINNATYTYIISRVIFIYPMYASIPINEFFILLPHYRILAWKTKSNAMFSIIHILKCQPLSHIPHPATAQLLQNQLRAQYRLWHLHWPPHQALWTLPQQVLRILCLERVHHTVNMTFCYSSSLYSS